MIIEPPLDRMRVGYTGEYAPIPIARYVTSEGHITDRASIQYLLAIGRLCDYRAPYMPWLSKEEKKPISSRPPKAVLGHEIAKR